MNGTEFVQDMSIIKHIKNEENITTDYRGHRRSSSEEQKAVFQRFLYWDNQRHYTPIVYGT